LYVHIFVKNKEKEESDEKTTGKEEYTKSYGEATKVELHHIDITSFK